MWLNYSQHIAKTSPKRDVYPLLEHPDAYKDVMNDLVTHIGQFSYDRIAGLEATGMLFGSVLSYILEKPFLAIRRKGKYPYTSEELLTADTVDYSNSSKSFQIPHTHVDAGERIVIVDDWMETGNQFLLAKELLEGAGATVVGGLFLAIQDNKKTTMLRKQHSLISLRESDLLTEPLKSS